MSNQFCPQCGVAVQAAETFCPFCQKALPSFASEVSQPSLGIDTDAIRRKQKTILWLFLIGLLWGAVILPTAFVTLQIAREEIPDASIRDVRFNRIEVQSKTYQTLVMILQTSQFCSRIFFGYYLFVWFKYVRAMGYSRLASTGHILIQFILLVNMIVFLVMIHKGRVLIAKYS
ncbi:MAG: zinc ribbon domain-containing protein [Planctomycetaceae bacterium]|nr:zinc ribbon domain-containing protein [Planctomycetaceae bacterium]